jgi:hypothetical protein
LFYYPGWEDLDMKPFTAIAALLLFAVAVAQAARAYMGVDVLIGDFHVPIVASWVVAGLTGFLSLMLFVEARR